MREFLSSLLISSAFAYETKCQSPSNLLQGAKMDCGFQNYDLSSFGEGTSCHFSCDAEHGALEGPPEMQCVCDSNHDSCDFEFMGVKWIYPIKCSDWVKPRSVSLSTSATVSVSSDKDADAFLKALVGDDAINDNEYNAEVEKSLSVLEAGKMCTVPQTPNNGGTWGCSDSNKENSLCTLSCPVGYKSSNEAASSRTCTCSVSYDGPIEIDEGCEWDNTEAVDCIEDTDFTDSCQPLSAPENGTMTCTNGANQGSVCDFDCQDETYFILPDKSSRRRCKCSERKGCWWTRTDNYCQPPPIDPVCDALPSEPNQWTSYVCDNEPTNNHGTACSFHCDDGWRLNQRGHNFYCRCARKRGQYSCGWSRNWSEDKHCVPAPSWYRKWVRSYNKAKRRGEDVSDLLADYNTVDAWAHDILSEARPIPSRKRRSTASMLKKFQKYVSPSKLSSMLYHPF